MKVIRSIFAFLACISFVFIWITDYQNSEARVEYEFIGMCILFLVGVIASNTWREK